MKDGCFEARLTEVFELMYDVYLANKVYFKECTLLHDVYRNEDEYLSSGFKLSFLSVCVYLLREARRYVCVSIQYTRGQILRESMNAEKPTFQLNSQLFR
jgi:hypothetical protein